MLGPEPSGGAAMSTATVTTITVSYTGTAGGSVPWKYQLQIAPDDAGSPGTYYDDPKGPKKAQAEPVTFVAGLDGLTALSAEDILLGMLAADTYYWLRVRVADTAGETAYSNALKIKTLKFTPGPLTVTLNSSGLIDLSYDGTTGTLSPVAYWFQQCGDDGGAPDGIWVDIGFEEDGPEPLTHSPSGLTLDVDYWFRMKITDLTGITQYSEPKVGRPRELVEISPGVFDVKYATFEVRAVADDSLVDTCQISWLTGDLDWRGGSYNPGDHWPVIVAIAGAEYQVYQWNGLSTGMYYQGGATSGKLLAATVPGSDITTAGIYYAVFK
jgi:hypothetical protein